MKNNKGITIVELVVSMTVLIIIVTFLFQMVLSLKELYNSSGLKTELLNKQAIISKMINEDFRNKGVEMVLSCSDSNNCLILYFKDNSQKRLEFIKKTNNSSAYFVYGDYKTELPNGSDFGNYKIETTTAISAPISKNSILNIYVPITNPLLRNQEYGINIIYQYDSNKTSITDLSINGNSNVNAIWLAGSNDMIWYTTVDFVDPGYYYLDESNNLVKATDSTSEVNVIRSDIRDNQMTITYESISDSSQRVVRTVNFIDSEYNYSLNSSYYTFSAPVTGTYRMEAWGANGNNSTTNIGGKGAYTSGLINLHSGDKVFVYVGGAGTGDAGGYNGGGSLTLNQSTHDGAAGGGATDIRLERGAWDLEQSLKSRIMVAAGGGGAASFDCGASNKQGGAGGSDTSSGFTVGTSCSGISWTIASGASQTSGGALDMYAIDGTKTTLTGGLFGKAGTPTGFEGDIISGGGGGYYGGTNSSYGSPATGGSSFVSGCDDCVAINEDGTSSSNNIHYSTKKFSNIIIEEGSTSHPNPSGSNNGYAKITLVSISYSN